MPSTGQRAQKNMNEQWNFNVPNVKGNENNTFHFNAIKDWNSLPSNLKNCENIHTYKKRVKRYLLQMATEEAGREYVYL